MRRLLPSPLLSAALLIAWLALNQSASTGHLILGAVFAVAIPLLTARLRAAPDGEPAPPRRPALARWRAALRLAGVVAGDIVRANLQVARRILGPESAIRPGYVWLPLTLRHPHGRVLLAGIITMTPGTLSARFSDDGTHLLIHAFDLDDPVALIAEIRARYEAPLLEIFE
ncbi:MAG: Na+/H+ antiporter subunit E [Burkholderiales bacterium]|nr:Na+/H+ antiporter subunit E [Burkholderiales bacterium]